MTARLVDVWKTRTRGSTNHRFTVQSQASTLAAVVLVVAFGLSLSWLWAATALLVRNPATVTSLGLAALLPPTFASNIFVQPRTMPGWLQAFVNLNPISHVADAARDLMNNTSSVGGPVT